MRCGRTIAVHVMEKWNNWKNKHISNRLHFMVSFFESTCLNFSRPLHLSIVTFPFYCKCWVWHVFGRNSRWIGYWLDWVFIVSQLLATVHWALIGMSSGLIGMHLKYFTNAKRKASLPWNVWSELLSVKRGRRKHLNSLIYSVK